MRIKTLYSEQEEYVNFQVDDGELEVELELADGSTAIFWIGPTDVDKLRKLIM